MHSVYILRAGVQRECLSSPLVSLEWQVTLRTLTTLPPDSQLRLCVCYTCFKFCNSHALTPLHVRKSKDSGLRRHGQVLCRYCAYPNKGEKNQPLPVLSFTTVHSPGIQARGCSQLNQQLSRAHLQVQWAMMQREQVLRGTVFKAKSRQTRF